MHNDILVLIFFPRELLSVTFVIVGELVAGRVNHIIISYNRLDCINLIFILCTLIPFYALIYHITLLCLYMQDE